jgi:hypothetical protein
MTTSSRRTPARSLAPLLASLLVLATLALPATAARAAAAESAAGDSGPLDGRSFVGETGEEGTTRGDPEEFVFAAGKFDPLGHHDRGFAAAPYHAERRGDAVAFRAETMSESAGRLRWTGTVRGDRLEGTVLWIKNGQAPKEYWFTGTLQTADGS